RASDLPRDHRVGPPLAAGGVERLLRQPALLAGNHRAGRGGPRADRLVAPRAPGRAGAVEPRLTVGGARRRLRRQDPASGSGASNVPRMCSVQVDICAGAGRPRAASSSATGWSPSSRVTPSPVGSTCDPVPPWAKAVRWGTPPISV